MEERAPMAEVAKMAAVVLLVYGLAVALVDAQLALLFGFFAIVLAAVLDYPIRWLCRWMPRWAASILVLLACIVLAAVVVLLVVPVVRAEVEQLPQQLDNGGQHDAGE